MAAIKRREQILNFILKVIEASNKTGSGVSEEKLVAECCLSFYCGERLVKEILKHLQIGNKIAVDCNELYLPQFLSDDKKLNNPEEKKHA